MQAYAKKYINVHLKFGTVKNCHGMRSAHWYIVTSLLLQPCRRHFVHAFEIALFWIRSVQTH